MSSYIISKYTLKYNVTDSITNVFGTCTYLKCIIIIIYKIIMIRLVMTRSD